MPQGDPAQQAVFWLTWLTSGETNETQERAFKHWLNQDPSHQKAWEDAQALWHDVARLTESDLADTPSPNRSAIAVQARQTPYSYFAIGIAACLLLSVVIWVTGIPYYPADYQTGIGDGQEIALADGSMIQLNSNTAVSIDFDDSRRRLILHSGEAWFKVAPDPVRPFEVETDFGTVRALGTQFNIANYNEMVTVTVFEHAVRVRLADGGQVQRLTEGSSLQFDRSIQYLDQQADLKKTSAWRRQRMIFQDRKLTDVVQELNRYRQGRILIVDPTINDLPMTGVFDTRRPEEALRMIRQSLKLSEFRVVNRLVFLYRG